MNCKTVLGICLLAATFCSCQHKTASPVAVEAPVSLNPLMDNEGKPVNFGDPFMLRASDGRYYMYGTSESGSNDYCCYSSDDMVNWKNEGVCFAPEADCWAVDCFWAPEVYEIDGKFYMLHSANWRENPTNEGENFRIGVAVSDKPTGPFRPLMNRPIFDPGYPIIDANLLVAEDGRLYLYYSRCCYKHAVESELSEKLRAEGKADAIEESWIYGVEIEKDFSGAIGEPVMLLCPPSKLDDPQTAWESQSALSGEAQRRWTEGSFIFRHDDTYYMMYSSNFYGGPYYAVGYATSKNPLGPFTKSADNPVLQRNNDKGGEVFCTGHNMVLQDGDKMYCVYHAHTNYTDSLTQAIYGNTRRIAFIDEMEITPEGKLVVHGPTTK